MAAPRKAPATVAAKEIGRVRDQPKSSSGDAQNQQPTQLPDTDVKAMDAKQADVVASKVGDSATEQTGSTTTENKPDTEASPPPSDAKLAEAKPTENLVPPTSSTDATDGSRLRALEKQIRGAAAVAEQLTFATTNHTDAFDTPLSNDPRNDNKHLAALVLARSDIKSVSELAGKTIAMDDLHLGSGREVRTALVAAGATDIQIDGEGGHAVDKLVEGQVPAAILTVVSQDAAGAFPDVLGFKLFAIPLSPSDDTR